MRVAVTGRNPVFVGGELNRNLLQTLYGTLNTLRTPRLFLFYTDENADEIINENEKIIGYALCDMSKIPIYLRQFFIRREQRRK